MAGDAKKERTPKPRKRRKRGVKKEAENEIIKNEVKREQKESAR